MPSLSGEPLPISPPHQGRGHEVVTVACRITYSLSIYTLSTSYFIPMVLLPHHMFIYIKSQELHELAWLPWRRAFFHGAVDFLNMLPVGHFFGYVQDLLRMGVKKLTIWWTYTHGRYSYIVKAEAERFRFR
uniref:Uncharacterized protein n=1 Tax=Aegilops tauschii subsp. strangulata TaxID=200361 RepID=A0A453BGS6_AEGTS